MVISLCHTVYTFTAGLVEDISGPNAKINFGALSVQSPELTVHVEHEV